ncbi:MAG: hypothetical protein JJ863_14850 [Deltaproteobacteria bacterium]|nr:hypothetical protein [Deltaproteobacteria bacterium]
MKDPVPTEEGRVVGWYRPDVSLRIWLLLPGCILLTVVGALLVGYGYGRLERADPIGLHADARAFEETEHAAAHDRFTPHDRGEGDAAGAMWIFFVLGLALVASGPGVAILVLRRIWARDDFLLLRTDALIASHEGRHTRVAWDAIEAIAFVPERGVELRMRDGGLQLVDPALVDDGETLAKQLEEVRRKSTWGLLPQQR